MASNLIVARFPHWKYRFWQRQQSQPLSLHYWLTHPQRLPRFVRESAVAQRYMTLLSPLNWAAFPERNLEVEWGAPTVPYTAFAAACLIKLDQGLVYMSRLHRYLVEHPELVWLLGFPLVFNPRYPHGIDVEASLPTARHLTRMLRTVPNSACQSLLDQTVWVLMSELRAVAPNFGRSISLDTKHIIAWVKENNRKAYVKTRYDKAQQPAGDPDCRLGCKRKRNQRSAQEAAQTPTEESVPAHSVGVGEYYWGYGSGVVATKVSDYGEFVLAELTQTFDCGDVSYFHPLMAQAERRLGFRPAYGALDAIFDAWYVYEYFHAAGGFAAVPFVIKGQTQRTFSAEGLPLCAAGLPMPLKFTYTSRTTGIVEHEKGRYVCPLYFPESTETACPIADPHWEKGGCATTLSTSIGARIRYQLDREGEDYKQVYKQRTATERINALAVDLGIERPKLRNGAAIANQNTLLYVLLNLRALQRVRQRQAQPT